MVLLRDYGATQAVIDKMRATSDPRLLCVPEYYVFSRGTHVNAWDWTVPKPKGDSGDLMLAYEELANAPTPLKKPGALFNGLHERWPAGWVSGLRRPWHWYDAAVRLVALSVHYGASPEWNGRVLRADVDGYKLEVSRRRIYSNTMGSYLPTPVTVSDFPAGLSINCGGLRSPLLDAVWGCVGEEHKWLAGTVVLGEQQGLYKITPDALRFEQAPRRGSHGRGRPAWKPNRDALEVIEYAIDFLNTVSDDHMGVASHLYEIMVGPAFSHNQFVSMFGDPEKFPNRGVGPTRQAWLRKLKALSD